MRLRTLAVMILAAAAAVYILDLPAWAALLLFADLAALIGLAFFAFRERIELRDERRRSAKLRSWIDAHHHGTAYQPFDGDEATR
jgi:membrane protein implicated in regulation of membrane protease activity